MKRNFFINIFFIIYFNLCCCSADSPYTNSEFAGSNEKSKNRKPAVAGSFYPADKKKLTDMLDQLFFSAKPKSISDVIALITPHAGYIFSGKTAASAYNQLDPEKQYKNIFIICSSHTEHFEGASIFDSGDFITPLGTVEVNREISGILKSKTKFFNSPESPHISEHSIETQLPFLQHKLKNKFKIIPISLGAFSSQFCQNIAQELSPYFNSENLFIISSDFSHYPDADGAVKIDSYTAEVILANNSAKFLNCISGNRALELKIKNLATQACGASSILSLLFITEKIKDLKVSLIDYTNSSDASKDYSRVVGYNAIAFSAYVPKALDKTIIKEKTMDSSISDKSENLISDSNKKILLNLARETIQFEITKKSKSDLHQIQTEIKKINELNIQAGAFVTLHKNGQLRGCIGRFMADQPLYKTIIEMAIASSTQDYRFNPVSASEINDLQIEISVLSPLQKIKSIDEIILGKHGIYLKKGIRSGTFLPQVATETGWSKEEFLGHCAADKTGIGWDGWKDKNTEIFIYSAEIFHE